MAAAAIQGEKRCEVCGCLFVNKEDSTATRCKGCVGRGPEDAGANENFIFQDIKRSDMEAKLNACLVKLDTILKLMGEKKSGQEYSKKCGTCGNVFVSESPLKSTAMIAKKRPRNN